jgi:hypothetical protein
MASKRLLAWKRVEAEILHSPYHIWSVVNICYCGLVGNTQPIYFKWCLWAKARYLSHVAGAPSDSKALSQRLRSYVAYDDSLQQFLWQPRQARLVTHHFLQIQTKTMKSLTVHFTQGLFWPTHGLALVDWQSLSFAVRAMHRHRYSFGSSSWDQRSKDLSVQLQLDLVALCLKAWCIEYVFWVIKWTCFNNLIFFWRTRSFW